MSPIHLFGFYDISAEQMRFLEKTPVAFMASTIDDTNGKRYIRGLVQFKKGTPVSVARMKDSFDLWRLVPKHENPWTTLSSMMSSNLPISIRGDPINLGFGESGRYCNPIWSLAKNAVWQPGHPAFESEYNRLSGWNKTAVDGLINEMIGYAEEYHAACGKHLFPRLASKRNSLVSEPTIRLF